MRKQWSVVSGRWSDKNSGPLARPFSGRQLTTEHWPLTTATAPSVCPFDQAHGRHLSTGEASPTDHRPLTTDHFLRAGISLMEVLISIGIMAIGMVSIASLLPVGSIQVERGNVEERKAELGLNAFREFQIRGMGNPNNWVGRYSGAPPWSVYVPPTPAAPVAIDPIMLSKFPSPSATILDNFPAATSSPVPMKRLTVKAACTQTGTSPNYKYPPNQPLAEAISTLTNDLVVDQPDDRTLPATGRLDSTNSKRDYEGAYTWLATLAPDVGTASPTGPMSQIVLSIVIFNRRTVGTLPAAGSGQEEFLLDPVKIMVSGSPQQATAGTVNIGGGDITISDSTPQADAKLALARPGNWMMLCRTNASGPSTFKWYRIISAAEGSSAGTNDLTLAGPDWVWGGNTYPTYACLFDGAVAVYQRVIHLDGPSVWNQ